MDDDYASFHRDRANLVIHIFAVPLFVLGVVAGAWCATSGRLIPASLFVMLPVVSLAFQGMGHKREPVPPRPFSGPANFVGRILAEQFFRFPLFVISGGWAAAMNDSKER